MYNPNRKMPNQNLFDFVIQNYGSLDGLIAFLTTQESVTDFVGVDVGTVIKTPNSTANSNRNIIQGNSIVIATGTGEEYIKGDYNDDYNDDYLI